MELLQDGAKVYKYVFASTDLVEYRYADMYTRCESADAEDIENKLRGYGVVFTDKRFEAQYSVDDIQFLKAIMNDGKKIIYYSRQCYIYRYKRYKGITPVLEHAKDIVVIEVLSGVNTKSFQEIHSREEFLRYVNDR